MRNIKNILSEKMVLNFESFESTLDSDTLTATITHLIENPTIKPPLITTSEYKTLLDLVQNSQIKSEPVPYPQPVNSYFTFIDLFAGIGDFVKLKSRRKMCLLIRMGQILCQNLFF